MPIDLLKALVPALLAFWIGIAITPVVTHYLYKHKVWKKKGGKQALDGTAAEEFNRMHGDNELHTPRMGGIVIWLSASITIFGLWALGHFFPSEITTKLDFLSRDQTWIPLFTLLIGALIGFSNDLMDTLDEGPKGIPVSVRLFLVSAISAIIGWWFYGKLGITSVGIPFGTTLEIGWLIIPFFMLVSISLYASGVIDGIDGLSGFVFTSIFLAYAFIAFNQDQINLAAFCTMMAGAILAFLWFNIPPARFWMTETGTMGITLTIAVIAFMTDSLGEGIGIASLPLIAGLLVITVISNILQVFWKKFKGRKLFKIAPLHHHFEAIGWPSYKVTMRYWVLSIIFAVLGVILALTG